MDRELMALGSRIKEAREDKGISIRVIADITGINKSQIVRIESGQSDPHYTTLLRIARGLGMRLCKLVDDGNGRHALDEQKKE